MILFICNQDLTQYFIIDQMKKSLTDYHKTRRIGKGSFGEIYEAQIIESGEKKFYAIKQISQKQILKLNKLHEPFIEKQILLKCHKMYPQGFIGLHQTHTDSENIYMILELCQGGNLDQIIPKLKGISNRESVIKRLVAKMVLTLEVLHKNGVVHRDLKPSNFLFKKDGTMKLADFGTAYAPMDFFEEAAGKQIAGMKEMSKKKQSQKMSKEDQQVDCLTPEMRRSTFVGTPLYMAPQLLSQDHCGIEADLWALGCIIYELVHSKTPFQDENEGMVWKKILNQDYAATLPTGKQTEFQFQCEFLISALLVKQRSKRLGYGQNGYEELKGHSFFKGLNWQKIKLEPIEEIAELIEEQQMLKSVQSTQSKQSEEEKIIFSGLVNKKMFFGNYKQRMLVLNSSPSLIYYDTETGQKKGEITLNKQTPIGSEGTKGFSITNQKKTYYFKSIKATQWIQMIKYAVVNAYY